MRDELNILKISEFKMILYKRKLNSHLWRWKDIDLFLGKTNLIKGKHKKLNLIFLCKLYFRGEPKFDDGMFF